MKTIIITGVCGFVGSVLAASLLQYLEEVRIVGLDNFSRRGSETNLEPLRCLGIEVRKGDIRFAQDIEALPPADWIIDCPANPSVLAGVDGKTSSLELIEHNLFGSVYLLEYCRRHLAGFILLSTSRVYSIQALSSIQVREEKDAFYPILEQIVPGFTERGVTEEFSTDPPLSLYGTSKRTSELLALEYGLQFGFPVWINRCGVLAGAGQFGKADQGIFSYWIHSWAAQRALRYIGFGGRGFQVRDILHPQDIVSLLIAQMQRPSHSSPKVLNISGGIQSALSLAQLSKWCEIRFKSHSIASDPSPRSFDLRWIVLDSTLASLSWNWQPQISADAILEEIAQHAERAPHWLDLSS